VALITLFTAAKPFLDPFIATIQRNAIQTWLQLGPEVEVLLVGDEPGMAEVAREFDIRHLPNVKHNQWGTPLVRSLFEQVRQASDNPIMSIVNADILLMSDFVEAILRVAAQAKEFLIVGRRWGLDIDEPMVFSSGWQERLRADIQSRGQLHPNFSIDFNKKGIGLKIVKRIIEAHNWKITIKDEPLTTFTIIIPANNINV